MKKIAILGAGGQAREIASVIRAINREYPTYEFLGYIVGDLSKLTDRDSKQHILGDESWLEANMHNVHCLAIGIGHPGIRSSVADSVSNRFPEMDWPALIHPRSVMDRESCQVHSGVLIGAGAICTTDIVFGPFALVNFGCTIGHDVRIGKGSVVNPGANVAGGVILDDSVLVGSGAQILQYRRVGTGSRVGAGAVVVTDVPSGTTVVGIPAKPLLPR